MSSNSTFEIRKFDFNSNLFEQIEQNHFVVGFWPLIYILSDGKVKEAYVGETIDALSRLSTHLKNNQKNKLTAVHLIMSGKFNKSATLDIESNLIKYISGDGKYKLLNANLGLANHSYYQKNDMYWDIFKTIWKELKVEGITYNTLESIDNSDLFKYSPYKSLSAEQVQSVITIIKNLLDRKSRTIVMEGGAGTGKTILAIYLFKLLLTDVEDLNIQESNSNQTILREYVLRLKSAFPSPKIALVVPMSSFRNTLKKVFTNIKGLSAKMVIGPAELANDKFDILIVDESHRLRRRVNLGAYYGTFDKACSKIGLDKEKNDELDWVLLQSQKQILFYDQNQSIKPSDVQPYKFNQLKDKSSTVINPLQSQFRVKGGTDYVTYVDKLLTCRFRNSDRPFASDNYEFLFFDSLQEMISKIGEREKEFGLSRLVAGYSWEWVSKNRNTHDILIDGIKLKWNSVASDWVNSENAQNEVGCIHTTQGYDLNYTGLIFGNEISYDPVNKEITIKPDNYFDRNGKQSIKNPLELKSYIINIYKTLLLRGIRGTYIFACDPALRDYLKQHISSWTYPNTANILPREKVRPYENSVPFYNIQVAAGGFTTSGDRGETQWILVPQGIKITEDLFACRVHGESMNRKIPNGSLCLFSKDTGGSRDGKIVLVQHRDIQDPDYSEGYTIKSYHSRKENEGDTWKHTSIVLKPLSFNPEYKDIVIGNNSLSEFNVIGIFKSVL